MGAVSNPVSGHSPLCPNFILMYCPVSTDQSLTVRSSLPLTSSLPSGLKAVHSTGPAGQTCHAWLSSAVVCQWHIEQMPWCSTISQYLKPLDHAPSLVLNCHQPQAPTCVSLQGGRLELVVCSGRPDPGGAVSTATGQCGAIGTECNTADRACT